MEKVRKLWKEISYSRHVIFHPFNGFWDLKHEKCGSLLASLVILLAVVVVMIIKSEFTGYYFLPDNRKNLLIEFTSVLLPFFLWCLSNWCITTLMDGEGSFFDIVTTSAYALTPMILINIPMIFLSVVATTDEAAFYSILNALALLWSGFLLFTGIMTIHQFSVLKTMMTCLIAIIGMGIMVFLILLFLTLMQQMIDLMYMLWREWILRF